MKRGGIAAILLLVVFAAFAGGCGGGEDTTSALTKAEFDKRAEVICNSYESEKEEVLVGMQENFSPNPNAKEKEDLLNEVMVTYERMTEQLSELGAPKGHEQEIKSAIEALEEAAEKARANPESVYASNAPFTEANRQVQALGLEGCIA